MTDARDGEVLRALLTAMREVRSTVADARDQLAPLPADTAAYAAMEAPRRIAALALFKSFEQLEDLIARTLRATLLYEQVDLTGLLPRAVADQAEKGGLLPSSDRWSDLVRLRNSFVHEYPMLPHLQHGRLTLAWHAADELIAISEGLVAYLARSNVKERR